MKRVLLSFAALSLSMNVMFAESVEVTSVSMDEAVPGTLPYVIANAPAGSTIEFNFEGSSLEYNGEKALEINAKNLIFNGINKSNNEPVTLKGAGSMFNIKGEAVVELNNLAFTNFKKIAIMVSGNATIKVDGCRFENNQDAAGAGVGNNGGVMRVSSSKVILKNSLFKKNSGNGSYGGGAVCVYGTSDLRAENCTFTENSASNGGAGICVKGTGTTGTLLPPKAYIANCTFANNIAGLRGALYLVSECTHAEKFKPVVVNCTFVGNLAQKEGAGVCVWSRTSTRLEITMVNNLFAENYNDPWENNPGEKCDLWAFYLNGDLDNENKPYPQSVFADCTNNFYEAAKPGFFNNKNTQFDFAKVNLFKDVEKNPLDEGDMDYTHQTSKLGGSRYVAMISENSIANGAGIASYKSIEIPTTDQQGNTRSATPSVGAAEFGVLSSISSATAGSLVSITCDGTHLNVSGVEGTAKVAIYNLSGSQVKEVMVVNNQPVALSALAKGVYGVKVAANNQITTGKIVIR